MSPVMTAETHSRAVRAGPFKALRVQICTANLQGQNFHPDEARRWDLCPGDPERQNKQFKIFKRVKIGCCLPCSVWKLPRAFLPSCPFVSLGRGMFIRGLSDHNISGVHHMLDFKGPRLRAACCRISHLQSHLYRFMWYSKETWSEDWYELRLLRLLR